MGTARAEAVTEMAEGGRDQAGLRAESLLRPVVAAAVTETETETETGTETGMETETETET